MHKNISKEITVFEREKKKLHNCEIPIEFTRICKSIGTEPNAMCVFFGVFDCIDNIRSANSLICGLIQ